MPIYGACFLPFRITGSRTRPLNLQQNYTSWSTRHIGCREMSPATTARTLLCLCVASVLLCSLFFNSNLAEIPTATARRNPDTTFNRSRNKQSTHSHLRKDVLDTPRFGTGAYCYLPNTVFPMESGNQVPIEKLVASRHLDPLAFHEVKLLHRKGVQCFSPRTLFTMASESRGKGGVVHLVRVSVRQTINGCTAIICLARFECQL